MRLRTKKSHLQNLPEGIAPHRILPVLLKFVYYMVLLGILGGLIYVVAMRYIYFTGRGQVEIEKIKISSMQGGKISSIDRQVGDRFSAGDILAVIFTGIDRSKTKTDIQALNLAYDIKLKQSEFDFYSKRLNELAEGQDVEILYRALEIGDASSRRLFREINRENKRIQEKMELLSHEIAIKRKKMAAIEKELEVNREASCAFEIIKSSFPGIVYHVIHQQGEYVKKGEPLFVVIPEDATVLIKAFFDRKNMQYLAEGQKMMIEFPDRTPGMGEIVDYLSSAGDFPEPIRKNYLPAETQLKVTLKPLTADDKNLWKLYDRMDVKVKGERR